MAARRRKAAAEVADRDEVLRKLTEKAREGNVTALKALLDFHERHALAEPAPKDDWSALYGDASNVTPINRRRPAG